MDSATPNRSQEDSAHFCLSSNRGFSRTKTSFPCGSLVAWSRLGNKAFDAKSAERKKCDFCVPTLAEEGAETEFVF